MKAKELRLGNWVHCLETNSPQRITGITEDVPFVDTITFLELSYDEIEPIPLTREWLIDKFEATLIGIEYKLKASALEITIRINAGQIYCEFGNVYLGGRIQYVHELQNLVHSLCGKELSVKF